MVNETFRSHFKKILDDFRVQDKMIFFLRTNKQKKIKTACKEEEEEEKNRINMSYGQETQNK